MKLPALSQRHLFLTGLALYALTAWRSEGYHHPDEHFQILEFANYRLGRTPAGALPWEFAAQIRPGLQPMLAYAFVRAAEGIGVDSPFAQAFLLRLLSGWLCLWLFFHWAKYLENHSGDARLGTWLRLAVVVLWFVPYLSVRFSSENWAGLAFCSGLLLLLPPAGETRPRQLHSGAEILRLIAAGFLLALSFFFRFQMGFALAGLAVWWVVSRRVSRFGEGPGAGLTRTGLLFSTLRLLAGATAAAALGFWADAWLYGKPVFAAYRYFEANIVQDIAANWGTSPWWFYFPQTLLAAVPPVGLILLVLLFLGLWRERMNALAWCLVPFLLAHIAVGHKEMRFLYPMLLPVLVLAVQGLRIWKTAGNIPVWAMRTARFVWPLALGVNFLLLPVRSLLAAQEAVPYWRFLYDYSQAQPKPVVLFSKEKSLYDVVGLNVHFYRSGHIQNRVVPTFEADTLLAAPAPTRLILSPKLTLPDSLPGLRTERIYTYFPDWILRVNPNDWQSRSRIWSVHRYGRAGKLEH